MRFSGRKVILIKGKLGKNSTVEEINGEIRQVYQTSQKILGIRIPTLKGSNSEEVMGEEMRGNLSHQSLACRGYVY